MAEHNNEASLEMMKQAQTMWARASRIVTFEVERSVALAVIQGHLAEYGKVPDEFKAEAVTEGLIQAGKMELEILKKEKRSPGILRKAILVRNLLIEAEIVKDDGNV